MKVHLLKRRLKSGADSLMLDYYHNRQRVREFLKIQILPSDPNAKEKIRLAEKIRAQRELDLDNEHLGFISPGKRHLDFFVFFDVFVKRTHRKDKRVFHAVLAHLKKFSGKSILPASAITEKFCRDFRMHLSKHLNGETPFDYFKVFIRILNEAVRERVFAVSPAKNVTNPRPISKHLSKEVLTDEELKTLFVTPCFNDQVKRAFLFCCFTGLRAVDVKELRWKNIDVKNKMFRFSQSKTGVRMFPPLSVTAIKLLGPEGLAAEKVFDLGTQEGVNKSLKVWVNNAKIKKHITFHCARHTFGTSLLVHGTDLKTASELLGHTTTRETEKYTHISEKMKRKAVDSLPDLI